MEKKDIFSEITDYIFWSSDHIVKCDFLNCMFESWSFKVKLLQKIKIIFIKPNTYTFS